MALLYELLVLGWRMSSMSEPDDGRLPVTLLTGFLGAGKTTLVSHVLKACRVKGISLCVVNNEFIAEVGVENELLHSGEGNADTLEPIDEKGGWFAELYEFGGGCLCCSASGDFERLMSEIIKQRSTSEVGAFKADCVVVETTGLAVPAPVARALSDDSYLSQHLRLASIVTVIDAENFLNELQDPQKHQKGVPGFDVRNEALDQLLCADVCIINKVELVSTTQLANVRSAVRDVNSDADILEVSFGKVDPAVILRRPNSSEKWRKPTAQEAAAAAVGLGVPHHQGLLPIFISRDDKLPSRQVFEDWLDRVIEDYHAQEVSGVLRVKGIVHVSSEDRPLILQGVGRRFSLVPKRALNTDAPGAELTKVVIFAYGLDRQALELQLRAL